MNHDKSGVGKDLTAVWPNAHHLFNAYLSCVPDMAFPSWSQLKNLLVVTLSMMMHTACHLKLVL